VRAMTTNQLAAMPLVPEEDRRCRRGVWLEADWPRNRSASATCSGRRTYGTGARPERCAGSTRRRCVLHPLTTEPKADQGDACHTWSNVVAGAFV